MYTLKEYLSEALVKHKISNYENDNAVDFGLSVKWLKYNLAGDKLTNDESDYGYYYQWASTTGYPDASIHVFDWTTCPYCNGSSTSLTKYVTDSYYGTVDNKTTLESMDDAVTALLGSKYRMPTIKEYQELRKHCIGLDNYKTTDKLSGITSVSKNGIYWIMPNTMVDNIKYSHRGVLFVGQDITKRIFFPTCGECNDSYIYNKTYGYYWSSSLESGLSKKAGRLYFTSENIFPCDYQQRYYGAAIRGVKVK